MALQLGETTNALLGLSMAAGQLTKGPGVEDLGQRINENAPLIVPPAGSLFSAMLFKYLDWNTFVTLLGYSGINIGQINGKDFFGLKAKHEALSKGWQSVANMMIVRPGQNELISAMHRGIVTKEQLEEQAKHLGTHKEYFKAMYDT